jgi:hypothetical protein
MLPTNLLNSLKRPKTISMVMNTLKAKFSVQMEELEASLLGKIWAACCTNPHALDKHLDYMLKLNDQLLVLNTPFNDQLFVNALVNSLS